MIAGLIDKASQYRVKKDYTLRSVQYGEENH
jgi:hypothetical protein